MQHNNEKPWHAEVGDLLAEAAELCVEHGLDVESFMKGAWSAYVESRPGMKEYLEELPAASAARRAPQGRRIGEA